MKKNMDDDFVQLLNISERIGNNPNYCTLSGGNTSLKKDGKIYVKGSGQKLSDANKKPIFVELEINKKYNEKFNKKNLSKVINNNIKPSIELFLHQNLPYKFIIHSHPIDIIALTINQELSKDILKKINKFSYVKLPYIEIGEMLGDIVYKHFLKTKSNIFILGNHGLIVAHDNPISAEKLHNEFIENISLKSRVIPIFKQEKIEPYLNFNPYFYLPDSESQIIHSLALDPISLELCKNNAPYPDHIVFCGLKPLILKKQSDLKNIQIKNEKWILIENVGVILLEKKSNIIQKMLKTLAEIYLRVSNTKNINLLSDKECNKINNMEQEKYRINILSEE